LESAIEISTPDASPSFECAAAYYARKDFEKARELMKKAVELSPEVERSREALAQLDRMPRH